MDERKPKRAKLSTRGFPQAKEGYLRLWDRESKEWIYVEKIRPLDNETTWYEWDFLADLWVGREYDHLLSTIFSDLKTNIGIGGINDWVFTRFTPSGIHGENTRLFPYLSDRVSQLREMLWDYSDIRRDPPGVHIQALR